MRVYEIAKQLGVSSKEILLLLEEKGILVKNHMVQLDNNVLTIIDDFYKKKLANKTSAYVETSPGVKNREEKLLDMPREKSPNDVKNSAINKVVHKVAENTSSKIEDNKSSEENQKNKTAVVIKKDISKPISSITGKNGIIAQVPSKTKISDYKKPEKTVEKKKEMRPSIFQRKSQKDMIEESVVKDEKVSLGLVAQDMTVEVFSEMSGISSATVIVSLLKWGVVAAKNKIINKETVEKLCQSFNIPLIVPEKKLEPKKEFSSFKSTLQEKSTAIHLQERAPVVVVIGHVDHGKTTLLDFIRKTKIAAKEKGGITQHLGAYEAKTDAGTIVFLDTPGHEAFSKIRQRGVRIADIAILVVAADDGVKPQTVEAIKIAQEMHTPIVVALNKIDKIPESHIEGVKQQLMQYGVVSEEYGGEAIVVPISAKTGKNIDLLLEMVNLQAQMMELKADLDALGNGYILESKIEKGRGPVATIILQNGILQKGDYFSCGSTIGHINTMIDSRGSIKEKIGPSIPVQISGFDRLPSAGDYISVFSKNEYLQRKNEISKQAIASTTRMSSHHVDALRIILKADNDSSREALVDSITKQFKTQEKGVSVISSGIGNINESDVELAYNTGAEIFGLHVKIDPKTSMLAGQKYVPMYTFDIIYRLFDSIAAKLEAKKEIILQKVKIGEAIVIKVFNVKKVGEVAGCRVSSGKMVKNGIIVVYRNKEKVGETKIASLQKEKESVSEVRSGFECGIVSKEKAFEWQLEDRIECFIEE